MIDADYLLERANHYRRLSETEESEEVAATYRHLAQAFAREAMATQLHRAATSAGAEGHHLTRYAEGWRAKAERFRLDAESLHDTTARSTLVFLADSYDALATHIEESVRRASGSESE